MPNFFALTLTLCFITHAMAAGYNPALDGELDKLIGAGGFYKGEEVPIAPKNLARALSASVRIGEEGATCSAVIISNDGYVATATHCIDRCLKATWAYQPHIYAKRRTKPGVYDGLEIEEQVPTRLSCPLSITLDYNIPEFTLIRPKIIWMGRGTLMNNEKNLPQIPEKEFQQIAGLTEDITVLKYEFSGKETSLPCVPAVRSRPLKNAPVWAIGFPVRGPGFLYNGYKEFVSLGKVRESITEDPVLQQYERELAPEVKARFWDYQKALWNKEGVLLTTLEAAHGNSGGMVINEQGELAAILFSITKSSDSYNGGTVTGVSIPYAQTQLRKWLGDEKTAEIFRCSEW